MVQLLSFITTLLFVEVEVCMWSMLVQTSFLAYSTGGAFCNIILKLTNLQMNGYVYSSKLKVEWKQLNFRLIS